jgi:acyl-CoA reductase-like NAD-dependent aldehyde dehydrogenase
LLDLPGTDVGFWRHELFGLANLSDHGLSAAIFTRDLGAALNAVDGLDVGVLRIHSESAGAFPRVPSGGVKASGHGPKEQGRASRDFYTHTVTVYLAPPT